MLKINLLLKLCCIKLSFFIFFIPHFANSAVSSKWGSSYLEAAKNLFVASILDSKDYPKKMIAHPQLKKEIKKRFLKMPNELRKKVKGPIDHIAKIDLDSDGHLDYIVGIYTHGLSEYSKKSYIKIEECLISSKFSFKGCGLLPASSQNLRTDGFSYRYFSQLDDDPMLELIALDGNESDSDYRIYDIDPNSWASSKVIDISLNIFQRQEKKTKVSHAYPSWIRDIKIPSSKKLFVSFRHCNGVGPMDMAGQYWDAGIVFEGSGLHDHHNKPTLKSEKDFFGVTHSYTLQEIKNQSQQRKNTFSCDTGADCKVIPFSICHLISINKKTKDLACFKKNKESSGAFPCIAMKGVEPINDLKNTIPICEKRKCSYRVKK